MARSLCGNFADPYCCKIKRNHPLGTHHLVKKGYAAPIMKIVARLILSKFLTQALQLQSSHSFHRPQMVMDEPIGLTAAIIPGTTSGRLSGSRVLKDPCSDMLKITSPPCGYNELFITFTPSRAIHFYHPPTHLWALFV